MKDRHLYLALTAFLIAFFLALAALWWFSFRAKPLESSQQKLELPRSAKFVSRKAPITFYFSGNPLQLPKYAEEVVSLTDRRAAREGAKRLRDGIFSLFGFDFDLDLADWIGSQVTFTFLGSQESKSQGNWILTFSTSSENGAKTFLQRFWQERSLAGMELQPSVYRGIDLISCSSAQFGAYKESFATALIDQNLLLIGSTKGALEDALDLSQLPNQNQFGDPNLAKAVENVGQGVALFVASPDAINTWLGFPDAFTRNELLRGLVASLEIEGSDLLLKGSFKFKTSFVKPIVEDLGFSTLEPKKDVVNIEPILNQLEEFNKGFSVDDSSQELVLSADSARELINGWRPWILLKTIGGGSLNQIVQGLTMAIGTDEELDNSSLMFLARLNLG